MRDLKPCENNEFTVFDRASETKIKLFYRTPTTTERLLYRSAVINTLTKSKSAEEASKVQLEWADKLITGFREGDFGVDEKPISSDKESEHYYPGWRGLLKETAGDILILFAETILDRPSFVIKDDEPFFSNASSSDTTEAGRPN